MIAVLMFIRRSITADSYFNIKISKQKVRISVHNRSYRHKMNKNLTIEKRAMMNKSKNTKQTRKTNPKKTEGSNKPLRWILFLLSIVVIIIIVIVLSPKNSDENQSASTTTPLRTIGPESAPVTITEYADFGCITCQAWHQFGIREQVIDQYGDQVQFIWRDFPVTTRLSPKAAEAGFCAHDQGRFWDYHDILFENAPALAVENLKAYADSIGLNTDEFNPCLDSGKFQQAVEKELAEARELGLRGVPSFIVNGKRLVGPPSFEQLSATIDEILIASED